MTLNIILNSTAILLIMGLAIVGAISIGVWSSWLVQTILNWNQPTAIEIENKLLKEKIQELNEEVAQLEDQLESSRVEQENLQNKIMNKLIGS